MEEMNRLLNLPYQVPPGANRHVPPRYDCDVYRALKMTNCRE